MSEQRKKPGVAFWATVVVVVALVAYPLSLFPVMWLDHREMIPYGNTPEARIMQVYYVVPVRWLYKNGPAWTASVLDWMERTTS